MKTPRLGRIVSVKVRQLVGNKTGIQIQSSKKLKRSLWSPLSHSESTVIRPPLNLSMDRKISQKRLLVLKKKKWSES